MLEKFPTVKITQLQINPTDAQGVIPSTQCLPCTKANPQANDADTAATYCNPADYFMDWDFGDSSIQGSSVSDSSDSLWFKAGQRGTSMSTDGNTATFTTDIGKPAYIDPTTGIVTEATLLETDITCSYPSTISGIQMGPDGMSVVADAMQQSDKYVLENNHQNASYRL